MRVTARAAPTCRCRRARRPRCARPFRQRRDRDHVRRRQDRRAQWRSAPARRQRRRPHRPHRSNAEIQTVSGDVTVEAGEGAVTLQSVSGDLAVRAAGGPVTLNSVSGDQRAEGAGNGAVSAQSVSATSASASAQASVSGSTRRHGARRHIRARGSRRAGREGPVGGAAPAEPQRRHRHRSLRRSPGLSPMLRNRSLAALLAAEVVSTTGSQMTWLALPWFVLLTSGSATRMSLVVAAALIGARRRRDPGGKLVARIGARRTIDALRRGPRPGRSCHCRCSTRPAR